MIVVAIIEILAAVAYANLVHFQMRTKAGEGKLTLVSLRSSEGGYFSESGTYIAMAPEPFTTGSVTTPAGTAVGASKRDWLPCPPFIAMASAGHCIMGFFPEGPTFYDYGVATLNPNVAIAPGTVNIEFFAGTASDIDGDLNDNIWVLVVPQQSGITTLAPGGGLAGCVDVNDPYGVPGLCNQVGHCGNGMGYSTF